MKAAGNSRLGLEGVLLAWAARAGAPVPVKDLKPEERDPADSLVQWATAKDAKTADFSFKAAS
jgi:hypothetical protein